MRLNRQTEHLKNLMMSGGQIGSIPLTVHGAPVRVGGAQTPVNHWAFEFLKAAAKSGLIDAEEVVNANLAGGLTMVGPQ
jgi:hypothetical protein